jgi:hypothetical protein
MVLLQAVESFGVFETLSQYGALGVITLALGAALWFLLKRQIASEDKLKAQVDDLQKEMNNYIRNDAANMKAVLDNNTKALQDLKDIILQTNGRKSK